MSRVNSLAKRGVAGTVRVRLALVPLALVPLVVAAGAGGPQIPRAARHEAGEVIAYIIPQQQPDQTALLTLLGVLHDRGVEVRRALVPFASGRVRYSAGAYIVLASQPHADAAAVLASRPDTASGRRSTPVRTGADTVTPALPALLGVGVAAVQDSFPIPVTPPVVPRAPRYGTPAGLGDSARRVVGVYVPASVGRPMAWTRSTLDRYGVRYAPLAAGALLAGGALRQRYDVVLLPDGGAAAFATLDGSGLRAFLDAGGTIVAVGSGAQWAIRTLRLPGRFDDIAATDGDSALVRIGIDRGSTVAADMVAHAVAWVAGGPATVFAPDTVHARVVARYDASDIAMGSPEVARAYDGRPAITDIPQGKGRVVLFGFDPAYRGVSLSTLPLLWGALRLRPDSSRGE
jgi:hypothetical protein